MAVTNANPQGPLKLNVPQPRRLSQGQVPLQTVTNNEKRRTSNASTSSLAKVDANAVASLAIARIATQILYPAASVPLVASLGTGRARRNSLTPITPNKFSASKENAIDFLNDLFTGQSSDNFKHTLDEVECRFLGVVRRYHKDRSQSLRFGNARDLSKLRNFWEHLANRLMAFRDISEEYKIVANACHDRSYEAQTAMYRVFDDLRYPPPKKRPYSPNRYTILQQCWLLRMLHVTSRRYSCQRPSKTVYTSALHEAFDRGTMVNVALRRTEACSPNDAIIVDILNNLAR